MAEQQHETGWDTCEADGCIGVRLHGGATCWAHASDAEVSLALGHLSEDGRLDARGVTFSGDLLQRALAAAPRDHQGRITFADIDIVQATFRRDAWFANVAFTGRAVFNGVTVAGFARFAGSTFAGDVSFRDATFQSEARFEQCVFRGNTRFDNASFAGSARFAGAIFTGEARFSDASFGRTVRFNEARFQGGASFSGAAFGERAFFDGATFEGETRFTAADFGQYARFSDARFPDVRFTRARFGDGSFDGVTVSGDARFRAASFGNTRQLGPISVDGTLDLDQAVFRERVQVEASAATVSGRRARFLAGVHLRVRGADVLLDDADLAAPSILSASLETPRPRLVSVQRADVGGLAVAGIDLRACRFAGAHHLDRLRTDECDFGTTPSVWWRTTRQTIAEEHRWRAEHDSWPQSETDAGLPAQPAGVAPTAAQVAGIYRDLRKGREDNKDEPGAADFYYGEMEMRRQSTRRRFRAGRRRSPAYAGEHAILRLYWLVSGYGLRAWRALATLAVLVLLGGVVFAEWGLAAPDEAGASGPPPTRPSGLDELPTGIRTSAQAAAALLRDTNAALTPTGEWLHLALRLLGPVLFGLAVLSVRGRVRR